MSEKRKSLVWEFFTKTDKGVKCVQCKNIVATKGNTSNLYAHLKRRHPIQHSELQKRKLVELRRNDSNDEQE